MKNQLIEFYVEYLNNFLSVENYAVYNWMELSDCQNLVDIGRKYYTEQCAIDKSIIEILNESNNNV
jgi:hypothetical protein